MLQSQEAAQKMVDQPSKSEQGQSSNKTAKTKNREEKPRLEDVVELGAIPFHFLHMGGLLEKQMALAKGVTLSKPVPSILTN